MAKRCATGRIRGQIEEEKKEEVKEEREGEREGEGEGGSAEESGLKAAGGVAGGRDGGKSKTGVKPFPRPRSQPRPGGLPPLGIYTLTKIEVEYTGPLKSSWFGLNTQYSLLFFLPRTEDPCTKEPLAKEVRV